MYENGTLYAFVALSVSDPVEVEDEPGHFVTKLSHPNLVGELVLHHGQDREELLKAVSIPPVERDPVKALFQVVDELRK